MDSKLQTSLLLILGPIVSLVGWMFLYPVGGDAGAFAEQAADLLANAGIVKIGMVMGFGGMVAVNIGQFNIARKMTMGGGPGSSYANIVLTLSLVLVGALLLGLAFNFAASQAASVRAAVPLLMINEAGGAGAFPLGIGVTVLLFGVAIALEKNFHIVVAGLAIVVGVLFIAAFFGDNGGDNILGFIGWIGWMLTSIVIGVFRFRASD